MRQSHAMGIVDISELTTPPEKHEIETANFLARFDKNIKFIRPSNIKGMHTPDFWMDNIMWEAKCPKGKTARCISDNIRDAAKQSRYIILDLRRLQIPVSKCLDAIELGVKTYRCKKIIIIPRNCHSKKETLTYGPNKYKI